MALKSTYTAEEKGAEIEETLDALDTLVDRLKVLYEQYFMGIQRQPPSHLHTTFERELRELQQQQIRNTALRYRLASLQQKHGAYNTYWKRTLREIEGGRYLRNLSRLRAKAAKTGEDIPEEILAKMPKRMRDAIAHDRELALAKAQREGKLPEDYAREARAASAHDAGTEERKRLRRESSPAMVVSAPPVLDEHGALGHGHGHGHAHGPGTGPLPTPTARVIPAASMRGRSERHVLDDILGDSDIDQALAALADEAATEIERRRPTRPPPVSGGAPAQPASDAAATGMSASSAPPTAKVVPPIRIVPPGFAPGGRLPARAVTPPPPRSSPAAARVDDGSGIPGMSEADTRALYTKYVKARTLVGDATEPMSYERMVKTLSNQAPKILRDHRSTGVEFNVVVRDNKVILKARPK